MIDADLIDNANVRGLVEQIKSTNPEALQVRFHSPLDPEKIALLGADGIVIVAILASVPPENPPQYVKIISMITSSVYNNPDAWTSVANNVKDKIKHYVTTGLVFVETEGQVAPAVDPNV